MKTFQEFLGRTSCPVCKSEKLKVVSVIDQDGVPPGEPEHNIGYNQIMLARCQSCGSGLVERLDHDCFDHDSVFDQYEWYILSKSDLKNCLKLFKRVLIPCPRSVHARYTILCDSLLTCYPRRIGELVLKITSMSIESLLSGRTDCLI
jgi:hypothetical protein